MRPVVIVAVFGITFMPGIVLSEDITLTDLRFKSGILSTNFDAGSHQVANGVAPYSYTPARNATYNHRAEIQYLMGGIGPVGGLIYGADVAYNQAKFINSDHHEYVNATCIDLEIGYGIAFSRWFHVEASGFGGLGRSQTEIAGESGTERMRPYSEAGLRLGAFGTFESGIQVGFEVPYLISRTNPTYSYVGRDGNYEHVTERRINRGFGLKLSLGLRF